MLLNNPGFNPRDTLQTDFYIGASESVSQLREPHDIIRQYQMDVETDDGMEIRNIVENFENSSI